METIEHSAKITLAAENGRLSRRLLSSRESRQAYGGGVPRYFVFASAGRRSGNCPSPVTSGEKFRAMDVTLTRSELDALIDEAVRKDRTRR